MKDNRCTVQPSNSGAESSMKVGFSGFECWFDVDGIIIRYWGSNWTGREMVTVIEDDAEHIVSDKRSFRFKTPHEFDYQGRSYRLDLSISSGVIELLLYRDGQLVDSDSYGSEPPPLINPETDRLDWGWAMTKIILPILAGGVFGAGVGYLIGGLL